MSPISSLSTAPSYTSLTAAAKIAPSRDTDHDGDNDATETASAKAKEAAIPPSNSSARGNVLDIQA